MLTYFCMQVSGSFFPLYVGRGILPLLGTGGAPPDIATVPLPPLPPEFPRFEPYDDVPDLVVLLIGPL
jgi:hypothetical protein